MPRPISTVHITPDFQKVYLRLPKHIQNLAIRKDEWFRKTPLIHAFGPTNQKASFQLTGPIQLIGSIECYFDFSAQPKFSIMMSGLMKFIANFFSNPPPTTTTKEIPVDQSLKSSTLAVNWGVF